MIQLQRSKIGCCKGVELVLADSLLKLDLFCKSNRVELELNSTNQALHNYEHVTPYVDETQVKSP
jgi:hypothetical protein